MELRSEECRVQLLGDVPEPLAETALKAVSLGAKGIDLNFGCPSRFVHHGGAMLLKEPELLHSIVSCVRDALPPEIVLSVKFRLGFASAEELPTIVQAVAVAGVNELIIHARTRQDLYKAEALNWPALATIEGKTNGVVVCANGDIVDYESSQRCAAVTKCSRQMIGRAALATPNMPQVLRGESAPFTIREVLLVAQDLAQELQKHDYPERSVSDRMKQFLGYTRRYRPELQEFFQQFCRSQNLCEAQHLLENKINELSQENSAPAL